MQVIHRHQQRHRHHRISSFASGVASISDRVIGEMLPTRLAYDYPTLIGPTRALLLRLQRDFLCRLGEFLSFKRMLETSIRAPGSLNDALQIFKSSPLAESLDRHGLQQFRLSL